MKFLRLKFASLFLVPVLLVSHSFSQQKTNADSIRQKMQWFADAKLGIFIHWGIYAVADVSESWSFHNKQISWKDYMNQVNSFTAAKYDPADWASLIAASGARYSVITTKHHDGVAIHGVGGCALHQRHCDQIDGPKVHTLVRPPRQHHVCRHAGAFHMLLQHRSRTDPDVLVRI